MSKRPTSSRILLAGVVPREYDMSPKEYRLPNAIPCPFCGKPPLVLPWHGGGPRKRAIMCRDEHCPVSPMVCGSTEARALAKWNTRDSFLMDKLRAVLLLLPYGRRKGHGPNVSMLGTEYEELCDLLGAPKR